MSVQEVFTALDTGGTYLDATSFLKRRPLEVYLTAALARWVKLSSTRAV